jgi:hypothetical protein
MWCLTTSTISSSSLEYASHSHQTVRPAAPINGRSSAPSSSKPCKPAGLPSCIARVVAAASINVYCRIAPLWCMHCREFAPRVLQVCHNRLLKFTVYSIPIALTDCFGRWRQPLPQSLAAEAYHSPQSRADPLHFSLVLRVPVRQPLRLDQSTLLRAPPSGAWIHNLHVVAAHLSQSQGAWGSINSPWPGLGSREPRSSAEGAAALLVKTISSHSLQYTNHTHRLFWPQVTTLVPFIGHGSVPSPSSHAVLLHCHPAWWQLRL